MPDAVGERDGRTLSFHYRRYLISYAIAVSRRAFSAVHWINHA